MKLTREVFHTLLKLTEKQPWVGQKEEEINHLIFNDCSSADQRELILNLLNRFEYVSRDKFIDVLSEMVEEIVTDPKLNDESTQVVAMAADSSADSSQLILYTMKPIFQKYDWVRYKHVNQYSKSYRVYNKSNTHKHIVLIDEFIGSGTTVFNRVKSIESTFKDNGISDYTISIKVLVSTKDGFNSIVDAGLDITSQIILDKGISDYYPTSEVKDKITSMLSLESLLLEKYRSRSLPSLGFGETESLYCRQDGNCPNSVFPIFWWPFYRDETSRPTILTRAMGDA